MPHSASPSSRCRNTRKAGVAAFGAPSKKKATGTCRMWEICCNRLAPMRLVAGAALADCRAQINQINARLSAEKPLVISHRRRSFCFTLSLPLRLSRRLRNARESAGRRKSPQLSVPLTTPRLRTLHCAEDPGSSRKEA